MPQTKGTAETPNIRVSTARVAACCVHTLFAECQLSTALRKELRFDMLGRRMISLLVFNLWDTLGSSIIKDICFETAMYKHLVYDDHLFHEGTGGKGAFLVVSGRLHHLQLPEKSAVETFQEQLVEKDTWLCEVALWTYWVHVGTCEAKSISQVVLIQSTPLAVAVHRNRHIRELAVPCAPAFHTRLVQGSCIKLEIADLVVPGAEFGDVIERLPRQARKMLGEAALEEEIALTPKKTSYLQAVQNLEREVAHDRCFLFCNGDERHVLAFDKGVTLMCSSLCWDQ